MPDPHFQDSLTTVYHGDCREVLAALPAESVHAVVTDPPYHLVSIVQRFGAPDAAPAKPEGMGGAYARLSSGFMAAKWDGGGVSFDAQTWRAVLRVLRPGGFCAAMGGTRTFHRLACAMEDAGFEIRDAIGYGHAVPDVGLYAWVQGQGVPKRADQLKPAWEPIIIGRKPLAEATIAANVAVHGTGALQVEACRIGTSKRVPGSLPQHNKGASGGWGYNGKSPGDSGQNPDIGRWPASVVLDENAAAALDAEVGERESGGAGRNGHRRNQPLRNSIYGHGKGLWNAAGPAGVLYGDRGGVSRYFFTAKASTSERQGTTHPTVKPVSLLKWLCRLVTPPGGIVLDPFAGSGSTRLAALAEGFRCIMVEKEETYLDQLCGRVAQIGLPLEGEQ